MRVTKPTGLLECQSTSRSFWCSRSVYGLGDSLVSSDVAICKHLQGMTSEALIQTRDASSIKIRL
jgi:hypothetical protein